MPLVDTGLDPRRPAEEALIARPHGSVQDGLFVHGGEGGTDSATQRSRGLRAQVRCDERSHQRTGFGVRLAELVADDTRAVGVQSTVGHRLEHVTVSGHDLYGVTDPGATPPGPRPRGDR